MGPAINRDFDELQLASAEALVSYDALSRCVRSYVSERCSSYAALHVLIEAMPTCADVL